ncbi:unnamed protein product [Lactuca saligna]|uniref:Uncharacterized protein n=1 Tax=Lactuca saligna TaxID=75948 RepID=A0AA36EBZ0_LACSI|nr:unnamed protein product [Lactuca saligna]
MASSRVLFRLHDARAGASGFTLGHSTPPISPLRQHDPNTIYGDDEEDFGGFTYSLFNIRTESHDEALVTTGKLKALSKKLDSLIESTKTSSRGDYSQETIKAFIETMTKEHSANLDKSNQAVEASTSNSFESNTMKADEVISSLRSTLRNKKDGLENICTSIQSDNSELSSFISSKIDKLHEYFFIENVIMDKLTINIEKVKVLTVMLEQAKK